MSPDEGIQISIGKFSQITSLSPRALRLYDEKGLLSPKRDRFNNYRFYTSDQIESGLKIRTLSWMGFSCAEIDEIMSVPGRRSRRARGPHRGAVQTAARADADRDPEAEESRGDPAGEESHRGVIHDQHRTSNQGNPRDPRDQQNAGRGRHRKSSPASSAQ